jgi:hypothetical protein
MWLPLDMESTFHECELGTRSWQVTNQAVELGRLWNVHLVVGRAQEPGKWWNIVMDQQCRTLPEISKKVHVD